MSKTAILYVSMIVVFVAGLWTTIHLGRSLHAPHDISGKWVIADADADGPKTLAISQSGRFVKLSVDGQKPLNLTLKTDAVSDAGRQMVFEAPGQSLSVQTASHDRATDHASPYQFRFNGPVDGAYTARRDAPADDAKKSAAKH